MAKNRAQIEQLIYDTFDALDPTKVNSTKYRELYGGMSDDQFTKHIKAFLADDNENFILDINELDRKVEMEKCEAAAKVLGIPLAEYVYLPHLTMDKSNVVVSRERALVGWVNIKRTQQLLHKKNGLATSDSQVNHLTGQVTGSDKDARDSDIEATMLVSLGAEHVLQELHGPRSDDVVMRRQMMADIATKGYVLLEELDNLPTNKTTLNTVNAYLIAMGIKSDLITDGYVLPAVLAELME
jgi:hypothetical protein